MALTHPIRRYLLLGLLGGALLLSACGSHSYRGTVLEPPSQAPDFTLTAHTGQPFRLSEQRGKVVLLFFGFTNCPDICPTALNDLAVVRRKLGADAEQVQVAFVTVDPERDSLERLQKYVRIFDKTFLGLRGTQAELSPILKAYGATAIRRDLPNSALGYTMDHSAFTYLIDQQGKWRELFNDSVSTDDMAGDIRYIVRNGAT